MPALPSFAMKKNRKFYPALKRLCFGLVFFMATLGRANESMVLVIQRDGRAYVSASSLAAKAGIAIKTVGGSGEYVACARDRCAPVRSPVRDRNDLLVEVSALSEALGATAQFDSNRENVRFLFGEPGGPAGGTGAGVGRLAPDFRLTRLDGKPVALSGFRGKRVLIN